MTATGKGSFVCVMEAALPLPPSLLLSSSQAQRDSVTRFAKISPVGQNFKDFANFLGLFWCLAKFWSSFGDFFNAIGQIFLLPLDWKFVLFGPSFNEPSGHTDERETVTCEKKFCVQRQNERNNEAAAAAIPNNSGFRFQVVSSEEFFSWKLNFRRLLVWRIFELENNEIKNHLHEVEKWNKSLVCCRKKITSDIVSFQSVFCFPRNRSERS